MRTRVWKAIFFVAFVASAWFLLSPGSSAPPPPLFPNVDKVEHVLSFAALALLARPAFPENPRWGIFAALVLWGAATEFAQRDIPHRTADVLDWLADGVGAASVFLMPRRVAAT